MSSDQQHSFFAVHCFWIHHSWSSISRKVVIKETPLREIQDDLPVFSTRAAHRSLHLEKITNQAFGGIFALFMEIDLCRISVKLLAVLVMQLMVSVESCFV